MAKAIEWVVDKIVYQKRSEYTLIELNVQKQLEKCLKEQTFTHIVSSLIRTVARYVYLSVIEMHLANHFGRIRGRKN